MFYAGSHAEWSQVSLPSFIPKKAGEAVIKAAKDALDRASFEKDDRDHAEEGEEPSFGQELQERGIRKPQASPL